MGSAQFWDITHTLFPPEASFPACSVPQTPHTTALKPDNGKYAAGKENPSEQPYLLSLLPFLPLPTCSTLLCFFIATPSRSSFSTGHGRVARPCLARAPDRCCGDAGPCPTLSCPGPRGTVATRCPLSLPRPSETPQRLPDRAPWAIPATVSQCQRGHPRRAHPTPAGTASPSRRTRYMPSRAWE